MSILVSNIRLPFNVDEHEAISKAKVIVGDYSKLVTTADISRVSIDARRQEITKVYTVELSLTQGEEKAVSDIADNNVRLKKQEVLEFSHGDKPIGARPVIVGFGPSGIFSALMLAEQGYRPIVFEKGGSVEERVKAVQTFIESGKLNTQTNIQFGEGGAGTFSDGKLTTRIGDGLTTFVLKTLVEHGAPSDILIKAKPHAGTDILRDVIVSIRKHIEKLGGEIHFNSPVDSFTVKSGKITAVTVHGAVHPVESVILAVGHSARSTFSALVNIGAQLAMKPYSIGFRIEHLQSEIDKSLYGKHAGHKALPPAEYQLSHRKGDRAVYTFCMCPGGTVVAAASEEGGVVTNGMSLHSRDGKNANSAIAVSVLPGDFGDSLTDHIAFQRNLEQRAFELGGGSFTAPASTVGRFMGRNTPIASVTPTYERGVLETDITKLYPPHLVSEFREGLNVFGRKLKGFDSEHAVLTAPETRTSSPVRILRGENLQAVGVENLYPCGEGAGYAGGIMSAAVDGLKVAMRIMSEFKPY